MYIDPDNGKIADVEFMFISFDQCSPSSVQAKSDYAHPIMPGLTHYPNH